MTAELDKNRIPQHIAIIMDGNGRWATDRGLDRTFGHKAGLDTVKKITAECARLGVKYLTLYTFSTENWNRPAYEIEALMGLVLSFIEMELFSDNNVRFTLIGDRERLPQSVQDKIAYMENLTAKNDGMTMVVAMSYSSKLETRVGTRHQTDCRQGEARRVRCCRHHRADHQRPSVDSQYARPRSADSYRR